MPVISISREQECHQFRIFILQFVFSISFRLTGKLGHVLLVRMSLKGGKIAVEKELWWTSRWSTKMVPKFKRPFSVRKQLENMDQWLERTRYFCSQMDKLSLPTKSLLLSRMTTAWRLTKMLMLQRLRRIIRSKSKVSRLLDSNRFKKWSNNKLLMLSVW